MSRAFRPASLVALTALALVISCGGGDGSGPNPPPPPPPPPPPTPANLAKHAGDNQTAEPGAAVAVAPAVRVTSTTGAPVPGVTVTFVVTGGGGSVTGATPVTGNDGVAAVGSWVLGAAAGANALTASVGTAGVSSVVFSATGQLATLNPTTNTTLSGTRNYASVNIPAGVTVTASADLVINATGTITIAGNLVGSCVNLTVNATGALSVSGTVNNGCGTATPATFPAITLVGQGGYSFTGTATVVAAGNVNITDDPTATDADFPAPMATPFSSFRLPGGPSLAVVPCNYGAFTGRADPANAPHGANGSPNGSDGKDGSTWTLRCKGGGDITVGFLSLTGQHGGNGGNGTHTSATAAVSRGGKGGAGGLVKIQSRGTISLGVTGVATGNGGNGGHSEATGTGGGGNVGASASATGGDGGKPGLFEASAVRDLLLGSTTITIGRGGRGGDATATGGNGHPAPACPPAEGGPATATAGAGGSSPDKRLVGSGSVSGLSGVTVNGGQPGNGGNAEANSGNGGDGAEQCKNGAKGGNPTAKGGDGGNAETRDRNNNLIASGGNGGNMKISFGKGGKGWSDCVAPNFVRGGDGGAGGTAGGNNGKAGTGAAGGTPTPGGITYNMVSNGGDAGAGAPPGDPGTKGANTVTNNGGVTPTTVEDSFKDGKPGQGCGGLSLTVTPAAQTVVQGGNVQINAQVSGNTAPVSIVVRDHQNATRGSGTIPTGSSSTTISAPVPSNFPTGTNTWTATASATGVPDATANFQVTVNAPAPGTTVKFCNLNSDRTAIWAARSTDGGQNWTQVGIVSRPDGGQEYEYTVSGPQVAGATVHDHGNNVFSTHAYYGTPAELQMFGSNTCQIPSIGSLTVPGNASGLQSGEFFWATMAFRTATVTSNGSFNWNFMAPGTYNVFASAINNSTGNSRAIFLQRNVVVPLTTSPFPVNLVTGAIPVTANLNLGGLMAGDQVLVEPGFFMTDQRSVGFVGFDFFAATGTSATMQIQGVPPSLVQSNDLHFLFAAADRTTGGRWYYGYTGTFGDMNVTLRNPITEVTASCAANGVTFVRPRVQGMVPVDYDDYTVVSGHQSLPGGGARSSFWYNTYSVTQGVDLDLTASKFTGANYNPLWGLQSNVAINGDVEAWGSNMDQGAFRFLPINGLNLYAANAPWGPLTCP